MLTLERQLAEMKEWQHVVYYFAPNEYVLEVAMPWFDRIGPERAVQYGTLGLNELGTPGVLAQVFNCYYRWRHMKDAGEGFSSMADVLRDALGFAVLMGIVSGTTPDPDRVPWGKVELPLVHYLRLKHEAWDLGVDTNATQNSFALAVAMYNNMEG